MLYVFKIKQLVNSLIYRAIGSQFLIIFVWVYYDFAGYI